MSRIHNDWTSLAPAQTAADMRRPLLIDRRRGRGVAWSVRCFDRVAFCASHLRTGGISRSGAAELPVCYSLVFQADMGRVQTG